ncbi:MAG: hypothetical protein ACXU81_05540 [Myxococcaceae bacterium]
MRAASLLALVLALSVGCTVDALVGSNVADGGTAICPGTAATCDPVCGAQLCNPGCTGLRDCVTSCTGTSCSFTCERSDQTCNPSCDPGPCRMDCAVAEEQVQCTMVCNPVQTCAADCHDGRCTVACGDLEPATPCGAGVYICSGTCPP